jgi:DNA-damage-inducible protein D
MESNQIHAMTETFEGHAQQTENGVEYWLAREHQMRSEPQISQEHVANNEAVRQTLLSRGIRPESLPPAEDVKKVERRLTSEEKKALKKHRTRWRGSDVRQPSFRRRVLERPHGPARSGLESPRPSRTRPDGGFAPATYPTRRGARHFEAQRV